MTDNTKRAREIWMQKRGMAEPKYCANNSFELYSWGFEDAQSTAKQPPDTIQVKRSELEQLRYSLACGHCACGTDGPITTTCSLCRGINKLDSLLKAGG